MTQRFGEDISEQDAYDTAREALTHVSDEDLASFDSLAQGPMQQQALADERAARGL